MAEKVKAPIQQLQQLQRISYQPGQEGVSQSRSTNTIEELQLEKVIGTSSKGQNSLQVNPVNGDICYLAGSNLVIYSPRDAKQIKFLPSRTHRPFQCVRFSNDGKYLAAGESAFRLPQITIWEITYEEIEQAKPVTARADSMVESSATAGDTATESQEVIIIKKAVNYAEINHLQGHKYGIEAVLFSPRNDFLISLGDVNDRGLFVWDWRNETKISQNLLSKPALQVEISPKQDFFVTSGYQHLKYWYLNEETGLPDARKPNAKSPPIIQAHSVDLAKVKLQIFVGITIEWPRVFVLASDGHIYVFDKQGKLLKWMNIKVPRAFSCSAVEGRLYCACSDGIIRIFATENLQHLLSLSKPPPLGSTNLQAGNSRIRIQQNKTNKFADVVACAVDTVNKRAVALYSDRMMFVWDVAELKTVTVLRSMYSHSGPIHDIQVVDNMHKLGLNEKPTSHPRCESEDNLTKFVTCSSDRTIRFWNFIDQSVPSQKYQEIYQSLAKNAYCKDMSQMIFIVSAMRESSESTADKTPYDHFKAGPLDRGEDGKLVDINDQSGINLNEMVDSIRCIRVSPDGTELASGDEVGNIRVHSLETLDFAQKRFLESHDSEVISLAYSAKLPPSSRRVQHNSIQSQKGRYMLASGGRDKQVLCYDSENNYEVFMSMDHHASTITSLAFNDYATHSDNTMKEYKSTVELISSSADKSLISKRLDSERFKIFSEDLELAGSDMENPLFKHAKTQICKDKIMSLDVAKSAQYMVSGHDKSLCLWRLPSFERVWEKRVASMQEGPSQSSASVNQVQLRVLIDQYASVVVSSSTSKRVTIYEAYSSKPLCRAQPGQITTAMCFSNNMRHLITTSDNGIIFIWRLPEKLAQCLQKIKNQSQRLEAAIERTPSVIEEAAEDDELGDSGVQVPGSNAQVNVEVREEQDFNFDTDVPSIPEKAKQQDIDASRENTIVRKKKEEVADVLALVNSAANFVEQIYQKETPKINAGKKAMQVLQVAAQEADEPACEEEEEEEAQEFFVKRREHPFGSQEVRKEENKEAPQDNALEQQLHDETLDEGAASENEDVTRGEQEGHEEIDPATENALLRKLEQVNYQRRFTNYNDDESDVRSRRSVEVFGRKSIASRMSMRRVSTFVPGFDQRPNESHPPDFPKPTHSPSVFVQRNETDKMFPSPEESKATLDPVMDIIDDSEDILKQKFSPVVAGSQPTKEPKQVKATDLVSQVNKGNAPLLIEDFQASLEKHNFDAEIPSSPLLPAAQAQQELPQKRERAGWGPLAQQATSNASRRSPNKNTLQKDFAGDEQFKKFQAVQGKPIDTRPTMLEKGPTMTDQERKRSPIKRIADKLFGRSPQKKRIGTVEKQLVQPLQPLAQPLQPVNVGNFKINNDYINNSGVLPSPTARSAQFKSQPALQQKSPRTMQSQHADRNTALLNQDTTKAEVAVEAQPPSPATLMARPMPSSQPLFMKPQSHHPSMTVEVPAIQSRPLINKIGSVGVEMNEENKLLGTEISEEQKFNNQLQGEINSINASLARINSLTNMQKENTMKANESQSQAVSTKAASTTQNVDDISMDLRGTQLPSMRVHDKVSSQLFKTMSKWNTMIKDLQESTNFDYDKVSMSFQGGASEAGNPLDSSRLTASHSVHSQSQIKEETRDLLDKYSQLLIESIQEKLVSKMSKRD